MALRTNIKQILRKNSLGSDFARRRINFVEGTNITIGMTDSPANNETVVTITAAGGGGGSGTATFVGTTKWGID